MEIASDDVVPAGIERDLTEAFSASASELTSISSSERPHVDTFVLARLRAVGTAAHVLATIITLVMALRTFMYVMQRRRGVVGPAPAARLAMFWAVYGAINFASVFVSSYFDLFGLGWLLRTIQALALLVLSFGHRLRMSEKVYQSFLHPFFEARAPEIESQLERGRAQLREVDNAARALAEFLLEHMAVGGLSGAVNALVTLGSEASDPAEARKTRQSALGMPERIPIAPSPGSQNFYAGEANERAGSVTAPTPGFVRPGVQQGISAIRLAYEGSRSMRAQFRRRHGRNIASDFGDVSDYGDASVDGDT